MSLKNIGELKHSIDGCWLADLGKTLPDEAFHQNRSSIFLSGVPSKSKITLFCLEFYELGHRVIKRLSTPDALLLLTSSYNSVTFNPSIFVIASNIRGTSLRRI